MLPQLSINFNFILRFLFFFFNRREFFRLNSQFKRNDVNSSCVMLLIWFQMFKITITYYRARFRFILMCELIKIYFCFSIFCEKKCIILNPLAKAQQERYYRSDNDLEISKMRCCWENCLVLGNDQLRRLYWYDLVYHVENR